MMFYLKSTDWTPKEPFFAIKTEGDLHPCCYQSDAKKGKFEAFIRGKGWKKAKKAQLVPLFEGTTKADFEAYLKTWGKYCLFYAITGKELNSGDCIVWHAQQEFIVLLSVGYDYIQSFYERITAINRIIDATIKKHLNVTEITTRYIQNKKGFFSTDKFFQVRPTYSLMAYFITAPHVDVVSDDDKLWKHFVELYKPTEAEMQAFPVSMRDRLTFLFGKEASDMYEAVMKDFPMSYNPNEVKEAAMVGTVDN